MTGVEFFGGVVVNLTSNLVEKVFAKSFSVIHKDALAKATVSSLKELLDLIENELLDADFSDDDLEDMRPHVKLFIEKPAVIGCLEPLFVDPNYKLDPKVFADDWDVVGAPNLPEGFSWQRIAKRFERKVSKIRNDDRELKEIFDSLQASQNSNALSELAGLPPEFDLDTYRNALIERFGNLNFDSIDTSGANYNAVRLWSVFVPQSARECDAYQPHLLEWPKEHQKRLLENGEIDGEELAELEKLQQAQRQAYFDKPLRPILDSCHDPKLQLMVILGDPGSGKSSLLRYLALEWARNDNIKERYSQAVPILIELRDYNRWQCDKGKCFTAYLHHASTWHRLNQQTLDFFLKGPDRVVLLLDGLDEVFDPAQREGVINDIHRFSNTYENTRIIVTSRIVGYKAQRLRGVGFRDFKLEDLDSEQIEIFLRCWHEVTFTDKKDAERKRERLSQAIKSSPAIGLLAGNPLLLTMMAVVNRYQELPRDRVLLYEKASEVLLQQWDTERGLADFPEISKEIDLRAKTAILRKVAYRMQTEKAKGEAANIIQGEVLIDLIEAYLQDEMGFQQSRGAANALVRQLRERNFILCYLGADSYAFVHRTFLEYFCAAEIVDQFHKKRSLTLYDLKQLYDEHCQDDGWHEVLRLICGQVDEQFIGEFIEVLINKTNLADFEWSDNTTTLSEIPLAVWCLGEARNIPKLSDIGDKLFAHVCEVFKVNVTEIDHPSLVFDFHSKLIDATKALNGSWPREELNTDWKIERVRMEEYWSTGKGLAAQLSTALWSQFIIWVLQDKKITISFLESKSVNMREAALLTLGEMWPDDATRRLLIDCIKADDSEEVRLTAIEELVKHWPDDAARRLLIDCVKADDSEWVRSKAIRELAKYWSDGATRQLLIDCAKADDSEGIRSKALIQLGENWPDDQEVSELIVNYAPTVGAAAALFAGGHSRLSEIIFTQDLDGVFPYLDPRIGLTNDHIKKAAKKVGVAGDQLESEVQSLSEHLGWDIRKGSGGKAGN